MVSYTGGNLLKTKEVRQLSNFQSFKVTIGHHRDTESARFFSFLALNTW